MTAQSALMKRINAGMVLAIAATFSTPTFPATPVTDTVVSVKQDPLPVYATPDDATPVISVHVQGLPWTIEESKNDYYRVNIDGKDYWVDAMTVHVSRAISASCLRQAVGTRIAADLGASTDHCK